MFGLQSYEGFQGDFGFGSWNHVENLNKALSAGYDRPPSSDGGALRVESLEATLRVVTFTLNNIKFWKRIPKLPAYSTVEEYNILDQYGADAGPFTLEGELPQTQDSDYLRKVAYVKFLGTTREVTHPMTLVRPAHGNVIGLETQNGAIWLLERLERALFTGRSDIVTQEFDGIDKQILDGSGITNPWTTYPVNSSNTVIDMRGAKPGEDDLEQAANFIVQNYGTPTTHYAAPRAMSDLARSFFPRERVNLPYSTEGRVGLAVNSMVTSAGLVELQQDVFLRSGRNNGVKTPPVSATSSNAPSAPTSMTFAAPTGTDSQFQASDNGVYTYKVTALNRFGESAPTAGGSTPTIAATQHVVSTITDSGTAPNAATGFNIYRSAAGGSTLQLVTRIPIGTVGGTTTWTDYNFYIPGTSKMYMLQENLQSMSFRQLAPMMKIPLATIAASIRWMQLLYGTPIVYSPLRNVVFLNTADA